MSSTVGRSRLVEKVEEALADFAVPADARMVVAVSGGADSTALLCALREIRGGAFRLTAVHVSHGLREKKATAAESSFLEGLCMRLEVPLRVESVPPGHLESKSSREHRSIEDVAREERYARLDRAAAETDSPFIAVAHTLDDQLETMIMRLLQGGGLRGMSGIPPRRRGVLRPLLECERSEVLDFLESRAVDYCVDDSNSDERYLRNRVRQRIIPAVRSVFPGASTAAGRLAGEVRELGVLLSACARSLVPWEPVGGGFRVAAEAFFAAPVELRVRSVLLLYNERGLGRRLPRGFFDPLVRVRSRRSGGMILEGHGATLTQEGGSVFWRPDVVVKTKTSYLMHVFEPSMYHITPALCCTVSTVPKGSAGGRGVVLPESLVRHPLVVRSRKPGDTIHMKEGTKSLKNLFNEWGVAESQRDAIPIVEDRRGIWAVCGGVLGYRDRVRYLPGRPDDKDPEAKNIFFAFEMTGDQA